MLYPVVRLVFRVRDIWAKMLGLLIYWPAKLVYGRQIATLPSLHAFIKWSNQWHQQHADFHSLYWSCVIKTAYQSMFSVHGTVIASLSDNVAAIEQSQNILDKQLIYFSWSIRTLDRPVNVKSWTKVLSIYVCDQPLGRDLNACMTHFTMSAF